MAALEAYLRDLREIRSTGLAVKETSYYPALRDLLNAAGAGLKPKVRCTLQLGNRGAGIPDGGLFTPDQLRTADEDAPLHGLLPARGVVEVKGLDADLNEIVASEQIDRYLDAYGQVLISNYREFLIVSRSAPRTTTVGERFTLSSDERAFWALSLDPRSADEAQGEQLVEYLRRALLQKAPLAAPRDVAFFLASYARDARARIAHRVMPGLSRVRQALEASLGVRFEGEHGDRFFRSTMVQTLFYGVFSAWVLWCKNRPAADKTQFDWRTSVWSLKVPAIRVIFEEMVRPSSLQPLGLIDVMDWTGATLNRVDRDTFFARFQEEHAVQYFYEPFLEAFDPDLRKELGVWYTPVEVVRYMVARVDTVLREELRVADGLADPRVHVLDPCTGTGSYLVEVLRVIARTLRERGDDALLAHDLKRAAIDRVHGFEILPAPYVVAHLQIGLLLQSLGAPFAEQSDERASVFLTNALTGWEARDSRRPQPLFPELEEERDAAEHVKRVDPILVVLGNPPYNAFAGVSGEDEVGLVDPYKEGLTQDASKGGWGIKKFNLEDLYVRFFRIAERRITEQSGRGIVCLISNFSYLSDPSFVVMRQRILSEFDALWFDSLNGDSRETGKRTPDGQPDPSIFSTDYNRAGIRVGTAICVMLRGQRRAPQPAVRYRELWGTTKREDLVASLGARPFDGQYRVVRPNAETRFSFRPMGVAEHYLEWPQVTELALERPFPGLSEDRRKALIDIDRVSLDARMRAYFDPELSWEELQGIVAPLTEDVPRFDARETRKAVTGRERFSDDRLVRYAMRPFDVQWCYYSTVRPLWREPRPEYWRRYQLGTPALVTRFKAAKSPEGPPIAFARQLCDYHMMPPNASVFPFMLRTEHTASKGARAHQIQLEPFREEHGASSIVSNLSSRARDYLRALEWSGGSEDGASAIWMHVLAIAYSHAYIAENTDGVSQDWPRVPLPRTKDALMASASLGQQVAALLDVESEISGVTKGSIRAELRGIAIPTKVDGSQIDPVARDLEMRSTWGRQDARGVVMAGNARPNKRPYSDEERITMKGWGNPLGLAAADILAPLGEATNDVPLNDRVYWRNVPDRVWGYTIGGYPVIKKWLSYRQVDILGRPLTADEMRYVRDMARRIAALLLMEPLLDANYRSVASEGYEWPTRPQSEVTAVAMW